jgi:hypothetical protein
MPHLESASLVEPGLLALVYSLSRTKPQPFQHQDRSSSHLKIYGVQ